MWVAGEYTDTGRFHPIEGLVETAMESIRKMVEVNTILGDPVETPDGSVIVPVSRVSFGFVAGGSEFETNTQGRNDGRQGGGAEAAFPFGGGSGAGVSLNPVAFLVVGQGTVRLLPVTQGALYDRLIDLAPRLIDQVTRAFRNGRYEPAGSPYDRLKTRSDASGP